MIKYKGKNCAKVAIKVSLSKESLIKDVKDIIKAFQAFLKELEK